MNIRKTTLFVAALALAACASAPAVNGDWDVTLAAAEGQTAFTMNVVVDGETATATAGDHTFEGTYRDGSLKLTGDYYVPEAGYSAELDMEMELQDDQLKGSATWDQFSARATGSRQ
jgi:hypothetical protein